VMWTPPPAIICALVASVSLPVFVLLLSHGPWRIGGPMLRFAVASGGAVLVMAAGLSTGATGDWAEVTAALILFLGSLLAGFTCWTLVAWGFTLTMLGLLDERRSFSSAAEWCSAYTNSQGIEAFAADRCQLLVRVRLARPDGAGGFIATPLGRLAAPLVAVTRRFFGFARS
jgi:hypothetical protein